MGTEPNQLSLLYVLFKIHSAGGFVQLTDMKKGGLQFQFVKGSQDLCLRMAEELGEQLLLSSKVDRIEQTSEAAFVHTEKFSVMAAQVIVALDPVAAGQIHISSQQDEENVPAIPQWTLAKGSKIHCIYSRPFWRERNLSGNALWDSGPIRAVFDNSRPQSGRGVLVLFTDLFALNNKHLDQDERKSRVLEELVKVFGQEAALPMDYREKDWSLETTVGGCVANLRPGILTACGPSLRESNGRIHQVSAETALIWESHMEGAIRSGQAAGLRCLEMLTD
jgi:monoamine oxidase